MQLLAILNAFDTPNAGGVQVSARLAWQAIAADFADAQALLLSVERSTSASTERVRVGSGRIGTLLAAARTRVSPHIALFWHIDLLKTAPLLRLGSDCRRVLFLHGIEAWHAPDALTRRLLKSVDVVLANTAYTAKRAAQAIPELAAIETRIVHLGIGEPLQGPVPEPADPPAALMIGRLDAGEQYKGHAEMIAAWPRVRERVPQAQLWIVGEGDLRPELEALAGSLGIPDAVRFFGRCTEEEKHALLVRARCMALPSAAEGFGLVYLEAMRLGRPCLTGIDGGREVVNPPEAGFSVTERAPQEIADAVVRLLTLDDEWQRRSAAARARYERSYTASHFRERLLGALREARRS